MKTGSVPRQCKDIDIEKGEGLSAIFTLYQSIISFGELVVIMYDSLIT